MNKIIASILVFFGLILISYLDLIYIFVVPKLLTLYSQSNLGFPVSVTIGTIFAVLAFILGIINLYKGYKLFKDKQPQSLKKGLILMVVDFFSFGFLIGSIIYSIISPIYQLTTSYQ